MWRITESGSNSSTCDSTPAAFASAVRRRFGEVSQGLSARGECQEVLKRQLERQPPIGLAWGAVRERLRHLQLKAGGALPKVMEVKAKLVYVHGCHLGRRGSSLWAPRAICEAA